MPEHRLQKTRDSYLDAALVYPNVYDRYRKAYRAAVDRGTAAMLESQRLQDIQMEHDESRTP